MSNELIVSLPLEAVNLEKNIITIPIIQVKDDRTRIAADENVKIAKEDFKEFEAIVKPIREELLKPADDFQALRKAATDHINEWMKKQNDLIGAYGQKMIRLANEQRRIEQERINAERKAEIDRINQENISKAELEGTETKFVEFIPQEAKPVLKDKQTNSFYAKGTVSEKPDAHITDVVVYAQSLLSSGDLTTFRLVFDKPNIVQINKQCKRDGIDGREKYFPGLSVTMIPDVHQR
jgi:hypothetical protein